MTMTRLTRFEAQVALGGPCYLIDSAGNLHVTSWPLYEAMPAETVYGLRLLAYTSLTGALKSAARIWRAREGASL